MVCDCIFLAAFEEVGVFEFIAFCQFHSADSQGCFLYCGNFLFLEAEESAACALEDHLCHFVCCAHNTRVSSSASLVEAMVRLATSNSVPDTSLHMESAVTNIRVDALMDARGAT